MTQTGTTTRPITFRALDERKVAVEIRTLPAGTRVAVSHIRLNGTCTARVRMTLLEQTVEIDAIALDEA